MLKSRESAITIRFQKDEIGSFSTVVKIILASGIFRSLASVPLYGWKWLPLFANSPLVTSFA